jgi:transcription initiation factor TFIIIB Brf1 subunit/transcription initiation factor TFIIB
LPVGASIERAITNGRPTMSPEGTTMNPNEQPSTTSETHPVREAAKDLADDSAEVMRQAGQVIQKAMKKPTTAAAIAGAVAVGAAVTFGVLETAVGGAAAYITYRVLQKRRAQATAA